MKYKIWFYETADKAGSVNVHDTLEAPEEMKEIRSRMRHAERLTKKLPPRRKPERNAKSQ